MKLNPPRRITWTLALLLGALGIVAQYVNIPELSPISFWLVAAGWALLILATWLTGL